MHGFLFFLDFNWFRSQSREIRDHLVTLQTYFWRWQASWRRSCMVAFYTHVIKIVAASTSTKKANSYHECESSHEDFMQWLCAILAGLQTACKQMLRFLFILSSISPRANRQFTQQYIPVTISCCMLPTRPSKCDKLANTCCVNAALHMMGI